MAGLLEFIDNIKQAGLEWYNKYYAVYPAIVESTDDPERRGRIKISLPSIFEEGEILETWCEPCGQQIAGVGTGGFMPPYVGDVVDVIFENGNVNFPRYLGGSWADGDLPGEFVAGYGEEGPTVRGWVFASGQKILVDETNGKIKIQLINGDTGAILSFDDTEGSESVLISHKTGSLMQIGKDGEVVFATPKGNLLFLNDKEGEATLKSAAGALISMKEKITIADASGGNIVSITDSTVEVSSSGDVIVSAQNVNINAGNVVLGKDSDNAVLYSKMKSIFDSLSVVTALGPSGPPLPINTMAFAELTPATSAKAGNVKMRGNL